MCETFFFFFYGSGCCREGCFTFEFRGRVSIQLALMCFYEFFCILGLKTSLSTLFSPVRK